MFILRSLLALAAAVAATGGLGWAAADVLLPPPELPWRTRERIEQVEWIATSCAFLGLLGAAIALDGRRRRLGWARTLRLAALPALLAAPLSILAFFPVMGVHLGVAVAALLFGGAPSLLAAGIAYGLAGKEKPPAGRPAGGSGSRAD